MYIDFLNLKQYNICIDAKQILNYIFLSNSSSTPKSSKSDPNFWIWDNLILSSPAAFGEWVGGDKEEDWGNEEGEKEEAEEGGGRKVEGGWWREFNFGISSSSSSQPPRGLGLGAFLEGGLNILSLIVGCKFFWVNFLNYYFNRIGGKKKNRVFK